MSMNDGVGTPPRDDAMRWSDNDEIAVRESIVGEDTDGDAAVLRAEIAQTQVELSETVDALQEQLRPQRVMEQARDTMQETAERAVGQAKDTVRDATIGRAEQMVSEVGETARQTGSGLMETIRQNPVPAALVAAGLGWLWTHRAQGPSQQTQQIRRYRLDDADRYSYGDGAGYGYGDGRSRYQRGTDAGVGDQARGALDAARDTTGQAMNTAQDTAGQAMSAAQDAAGQAMSTAQDTAGQAATRVQQTASDVVEGTQRQAQRAQGQLERLLQDNPLAVGAVGMALGVAVGLVVPETQPEQQLLGPAHDMVMDKAQQAAQGTMDKVQRVAQEAGSTAKDAAQSQGLTG